MKDIIVECHSGHAYAERPTAFYWMNARFTIKTVDAEWRNPDRKHFQVTTENGQHFELIYDEVKDNWQIIQT